MGGVRTGQVGDLVAKPARELRAMIAAKAVSPVEVFDAYLARIEQVNPALNAVVALDAERGREAAKKAEAAVMRGEPLGILHGLPIGINDMHATAGLRTTFGSLLHKDNVPE